MNGRKLQLALLVSLGVNLFLVGLMVGGLLMGARPGNVLGDANDRGRAGAPRPPGGPYAAAAASFDPADRAAFEEMLHRVSEENQDRLKALRQARREAREAVGGSNFDPAAARAALVRRHQEEFAMRQAIDSAVIDFAQRLDPQERAALAETMRRRKSGKGAAKAPAQPPRSSTPAASNGQQRS